MKKLYTIALALVVMLSMVMSAAAFEKIITRENGDAAAASWSKDGENIFLGVSESKEGTDVMLAICNADFTSCKYGSTPTQKDVFTLSKKFETATLSPVEVELMDFNTG